MRRLTLTFLALLVVAQPAMARLSLPGDAEEDRKVIITSEPAEPVPGALGVLSEPLRAQGALLSHQHSTSSTSVKQVADQARATLIELGEAGWKINYPTDSRYKAHGNELKGALQCVYQYEDLCSVEQTRAWLTSALTIQPQVDALTEAVSVLKDRPGSKSIEDEIYTDKVLSWASRFVSTYNIYVKQHREKLPPVYDPELKQCQVLFVDHPEYGWQFYASVYMAGLYSVPTFRLWIQVAGRWHSDNSFYLEPVGQPIDNGVNDRAHLYGLLWEGYSEIDRHHLNRFFQIQVTDTDKETITLYGRTPSRIGDTTECEIGE